MRACLSKERMKLSRAVALLVITVMLAGHLPVTSLASGTEPKIGDAQNAADSITVTTNYSDNTGYEETKNIPITPGVRGFFGNLNFGKTKHYKYSATVAYTEDTSTYGSIRFVAGYGKDSAGRMKYIEVCLRPNVSGQSVLFLNGPDSGENVVATYMQGDFNKLRAYRYTMEYKNNKLSFWVDGQLTFNSVSVNLDDIILQPGFYSQNCRGTISNIQIWGDVKGIACPAFNPNTDTNLIPNVNVVDAFTDKMYKLTAGKIASDKNVTGRIDFDGITLNGAYTFYTNAAFYNNKNLTEDGMEYNWEGLIFRIAKVEKNGQEYIVEARIRATMVLVYVVGNDGSETLIQQTDVATSFADKYAYVVDYHEDGTFDLWKNKGSVLYGFDITSWGYKNVKPMFGVGCEVCNFAFSEMKLVSKNTELAAKVPAKPEGNGNYADTMQMVTSTILRYEDGAVYSTTETEATKAEFEYLPFKANDSYVLGFDISVQRAKESWMSPRIIFGTDTDDRDLALFLTGDALMIAQGNDIIHHKAFVREFNKTYRVYMLVTKNTVSVWVDDILMIDNFKLPEKKNAKTGIWFEYAIAKMSNIEMYYTTSVKYVRPDVPEKPILKKVTSDQYNAAEWMQVSLGGTAYSGYFQNRLTAFDNTTGYTYLFKNMPITDDMSYYYSATYKVNESNEIWKGPRFIFRYRENTPVYAAITQTGIQLIVGQDVVASAPYELKLGREYHMVIYSTPTRITLWVDGESVFYDFDLSAYSKSGLRAQLGLWFEMCIAEVTDIAVYGDKIVFDPNLVDLELYNNVYFRMKGVPSMPAGGINLFQNISMYDASLGALGAVFDSEANILTTEYADSTGELVFIDANGSGNLNGLKNGSQYVFSFKHKVDDWKAETIGGSGAWIVLNRSSVPSTVNDNSICVGVSGDALMLKVYQEGQVIVDQITPFTRNNGQEYQLDIVHGKNWIKVYVDNVLKLVATNLPTYNIEFNIELYNAKSEFKDFVLYELEESNLEILPLREKQEAGLAGKTIYEAPEYISSAMRNLPIVPLIVLGIVFVASLSGIVLVLYTCRKKRLEGR